MKQVYGYIRVSDVKQKDGVSLIEQKRIIKEFAEKNKLKIIHFYEENKTAAKQGRPIFGAMMQNLKDHKAAGVIIHKIDRSVRNLHDWANIGDLIDMGIDVFFAHESLNMKERGGRLSADIQAVMASDYVRNLRQETIKGQKGRLKQGYYPWLSPIGYNDNGKGKVKTINLKQAELVKKTFELYVYEDYNVRSLSTEMEKRGLKNKRGGKVCKNSITKILKNPFYIGLIKVKGKIYKGNHKSIIAPRLYSQVQSKLKGRFKNNGRVHKFLFQKQIRCQLCSFIMSGEKQKGHIYYRCQTKGCLTKSIREDLVEQYVRNLLKTISLSNKEYKLLKKINLESKENWVQTQEKIIKSNKLQIHQLEIKEQKLVDMYLEDAIDKEKYQAKRETLLVKLEETKSRQSQLSESKDSFFKNIENFLELCKNPLKTYDSGIQEEKRELLEIITSNLTVDQRKVGFSMVSPYGELANRDIFDSCALKRDTTRTQYSKIVYTDKKTSSIIPKPINTAKIKRFYDFLYRCADALSKINTLQNKYELPPNNTNS